MVGGKRVFKNDPEKINRRQSVIFWEKRNMFFSDIWFDIKGSRQGLADKASRKRSGAFPFELALRLINMYSVKTDTVLDPFLGTGTTMAAAMSSARNSIGCEIDKNFYDAIIEIKDNIIDLSNLHMENRLKKHIHFVNERIASGKPLKHKNNPYGFPVITNQEKELILNELTAIKMVKPHLMRVGYCDNPQTSFCLEWERPGIEKRCSNLEKMESPQSATKKKDKQLELF